MAETLKDKFYIAGKRIAKALDISARLAEIMRDEDNYSIVIASGYVNVPRENEYWGTFRIIFGRMLPAVIVWPILTPLITIIILSVYILYHAATALMSAAVTMIDTAISGFKWLLSPKAASNAATTAPSTDNTQRSEPATESTNYIGGMFNSLTWANKKSVEKPTVEFLEQMKVLHETEDNASLVYLFKEQTWFSENEKERYQQCADAAGKKAQSHFDVINPIKHFAYKKVNASENKITIGYVSYQETSSFLQGRRFNFVTAHMSVNGPGNVYDGFISLGGSEIGILASEGCALARKELCETKVLEILRLNKNIQYRNAFIEQQPLNAIGDRRSIARIVD